MPVPAITPDEIVRGATAALKDVAKLEAMTGGACFDTRAFLSGVLLTAAENVRGTPAHTPIAKLLAEVRMDLPTNMEPRTLPAVWLATCEEERVGGATVVLKRAWPSERAALAWRDRNAEALSALGFMTFVPILVPVVGKES
jgi:hypothetical protein